MPETLLTAPSTSANSFAINPEKLTWTLDVCDWPVPANTILVSLKAIGLGELSAEFDRAGQYPGTIRCLKDNDFFLAEEDADALIYEIYFRWGWCISKTCSRTAIGLSRQQFLKWLDERFPGRATEIEAYLLAAKTAGSKTVRPLRLVTARRQITNVEQLSPVCMQPAQRGEAAVADLEKGN